ncbi:hypothetical protein D030_4316A, partial [Vibrio parahaemolyticus AQ3810]
MARHNEVTQNNHT